MMSVSTTKSSSNWLDRLRSSRGFPTGEEPDLDRFISTSSSGSVPTTESTQSESAIRHRSAQNDEQRVGEVSNVLCELFNMGEEGSRKFSKHKSSRKQPNPRFCGSVSANENNNELCSSDDLRREKSENALASSGDNSLNERRENHNSNNTATVVVDDSRCGDVGGDDVEERENVEIDLKAYSRSDVMVIDTSLPDWKFDGWVFRKNDEWKIKEKKSKSRVFGGKKRKLAVSNLNEEKLDEDHKKKKMKNIDEESFLPLNKGQSQNDKNKEPCKEVADIRSKVPQKRFPCPRPPGKVVKEGSSVILLKSIPLSNTSNEATNPGKNPHKKRRKQMKIV